MEKDILSFRSPSILSPGECSAQQWSLCSCLASSLEGASFDPQHTLFSTVHTVGFYPNSFRGVHKDVELRGGWDKIWMMLT